MDPRQPITRPLDYHQKSRPPLGTELLVIDDNSTITSDILQIWHDQNSKEICVELQSKAKCPHPALLGRLSGPGLAILQWNERQSLKDRDRTILCGGYGHYWLDPGRYFVEIIILYCHDFGIRRSNNRTAWLEADHTFDCTEDPHRNRITSKEKSESTIYVANSIEGRGNYKLGRWIRRPDLPPQQPLLTRFQPANCFRNNRLKHHELDIPGSPLQLYCSSITDRDHDGTNSTNVTGLYEYDFQWNSKVSEQALLERIRKRLREDKNMPKICAVGDSHSRYMVKFTLPRLDLKGLFDYVESIWISPNSIAQKVAGHDCDIFFSQVGHWPASYMTQGYPFSFGKYYDKLKLHVQNILKHNPNATIYLPTVDQAPLMARTNQCRDWRTPTILDGYSHVQQMIVREMDTDNVKYIDNNFILYTHWDGGTDWYHLMETVRSRKTIYMAAIMLGETEGLV